ncbi:MAG: sodium dependent phosphate transporter [Planctomycetes bacterium]|nr:sodium dependent phosphate transporter [Planctomycetota bacterium]MCP4772052.1 sodium dependent phosphate transporter [Planctomycetota bacterium]MCP4860312.1 sodium dependent phosphate transporter [Planctomycetota bacterium]
MESLSPPAQSPENPERSGLPAALARIGGLLALLFLFLVSIKLMETSIKLLGSEYTDNLFQGISNPFAGLAAGVLATVMVQSSSVSTSMIVALVGSGSLSVEAAVPLIMGANIGTTITNTLVSLGSIGRRNDFRRAFAAATVHDFFNLMAVAIFLPIQMMTGFLSTGAKKISEMLPVGDAGGKFNSPLKSAVKSIAGIVQDGLEAISLSGGWLSLVMLAVGLGLIFVSLTAITKLMRKVIADRAEKALNRALKRSGLIGIAIGALITFSVQSSSITTSLLVPLCSSGVLTLDNAFPVMLGANIGTTITAFLASLATDINGLQIALVHMLFNLSATILVYPIAAVRRIPIRMARGLAVTAVRNKMIVIVYVLVMFVLIPVTGVFLF